MAMQELIQEWITYSGYIIAVVSLFIALNERRARVRAEEKQKKEEEKNEYINSLIKEGLEHKHLNQELGKLRKEKTELESEKQNLDEYIEKKIPDLAQKSFGKYCAELYKEQLLEDYSKYEKFKGYLDDGGNEENSEILVSDMNIKELVETRRNNSISPEIVIDIILGIVLFIAFNEFFSIPIISKLPLIFFFNPIIELLGYFNKDINAIKDELLAIGSSVFIIVACIFVNFILLIFHFDLAKNVDMLVNHMSVYMILMLLLLVLFIAVSVIAYLKVGEKIFELNTGLYNIKSAILRGMLGIVIFIASVIIMNVSGVSYSDVFTTLDYINADLFVVGLIFANIAVVLFLGEICIYIKFKKKAVS